jgi:type IV pilus assembly protein PilM
MGITDIIKKDKVVGFDIGAGSVKMVHLIKKEEGLKLIKAEVREIPRSDDDNLRDEEIVAALKDFLHRGGGRASRVFVAMDCPETAVKVIRAPYMTKSELRKGITLEAGNYFPFSIKDSVLDFEVLGDVVEKGVRKYEVAVAVSPQRTVEKYLSLLSKAGIKPVSLVPYAEALYKLAERAYLKTEETVSFISIGETCSELIIFREKALMFMRKIPVTGRDFTKALTGVLVSDRGRTELTFKEAEKIKKEVGMPPEGAEEIIDGAISTTQIRAMLRAPLEHLADEIERSFAYYREKTGGGRIDSVVLFGGGAALTGLISFLSEELGVKVTLGDPLEGIETGPEAVPERDMISYRLAGAIGAVFSGKKGINLLPPEMKEETKRTFKRALIQGVVTAVVLGSVLVYMGMRIQLGNFRKRTTVARMECASLNPQFEKAEAHHLANMVLVEEPHWEDIFRELSHLIPDDIHLTNINMNDGVIMIHGIVLLKHGEQYLSEFILSLNRGIFKNMKLVSIRDLKNREGNEFAVRGRVE